MILGGFSPQLLSAGIIYGVTATELIKLDSDGSVIQTIGDLDLVDGETPIGLSFNLNDQMLYALTRIRPDDVVTNQRLLKIDPSTGVTSEVLSLGAPATVGFFEAIEFIDEFNTIVVSNSQAGSIVSSTLLTFNEQQQSLEFLAETNVDSDFLAYNPVEHLIYSFDPNSSTGNQFEIIDLKTNVTNDLGSLPVSANSPAYSKKNDAVFLVDAMDNTFYKVELTDGVSPINVNALGVIPADIVLGLAIRELILGDLNRDCVVSLLDVAPFVDLIMNGKFQAEGDINQNGIVDLLDVAPFVELLTGG